jgi:hypothetical protein
VIGGAGPNLVGLALTWWGEAPERPRRFRKAIGLHRGGTSLDPRRAEPWCSGWPRLGAVIDFSRIK